MKRSLLWGASLIVAGAALWWGFQGSGLADHRTPATGYDPTAGSIAGPGDSVSDYSPDHPGSEQAQRDRSPDRPVGTATAGDLTSDGNPDRSTNRDGVSDDTTTGPDRTGQRDAGKDLDPDCGNGPGDGECGNSPNTGDEKADNFGAGESVSDHTPDRPIALNRTLDEVTDGSPDASWKDRYALRNGSGTDTIGDRVGARDCAAADVAVGECDDDFDNHPNAGGSNSTDGISEKDRPLSVRGKAGVDQTPDGVRDWNASSDSTNDATPDKVCTGEEDNARRANRDCTPDSTKDHSASSGDAPDSLHDNVANQDQRPDASQDRANNRDQGQYDHNISSRDAYSYGAGDNISDSWADQGSLGYASVGGGGGGGCSMVAGQTTGSSFAYLLVLFAPVAVVLLRRRLGRRS